MGVVLPELEHGAAQCLAFGLPGRQFAIEVLHEIGGRSVIDVPETDDHGRGACIQKTTHQSEQFVSRDDIAEAGTAAAQSDQAGLRAELVDIEKVEGLFVKLNGAEHWIVRPEDGMTCNVNDL